MGSVAIFATQSLRAIEDWMTTAQANITGSVRVSFKEQTLMYGGGIIDIVDDPLQASSGKMLAEQALTTGYTVTNWNDGEMVSSTQDTHFAISGPGFFLVVDPKSLPATGIDDYSPPSSSGAYLTRDGEFHFAVVPELAALTTEPVLVNKNGLVVQADISDGPTIGNSDNIHRYITFSEFYGTNAVLGPGVKIGPSVVQPSNDAAGNAAPVTIVDYSLLTFSKYGSTVLEAPTATSVKTIINGSVGNLSSRTLGGADSGSFIREEMLESSNVDSARNITELAALGKMYNAFTQLIRVHNSNLDELLNFIR